MKRSDLTKWVFAPCVALCLATASPRQEILVMKGAIGHYGGRLVISERSEPKTLNPVIAIDGNSRDIIGMITADLIHINRYSQRTEPALARSWTVSSNGREYILRLRRGIRFSDNQPFDADDVTFTFQVYLDERVHSPQRELLVVAGKPIAVQKIDSYTVRFDLAQPYAAAERLFDSIAMLPRHVLDRYYKEGRLGQAWGLDTAPDQIAGLGAFRVKQYIPGQRIILEPNPHYWKTDEEGNRLPYLREIVAVFTGNPETEAMRFEAGEIDIVNRFSAPNFEALERYQQLRHFRLYDLGPGLEYDFLFFNLNDISQRGLPSIASKQNWFQQTAFREALSSAIDREAITRMVYRGRAFPLRENVTPGDKLWVNRKLPRRSRSLARGRELLRQAGFSWSSDGRLIDAHKQRVAFSVVHNAGNSQQTEMATLIQEDLKEIGIEVELVPLEFRTMLDRIFKTYQYEAAIMALDGGDADPNSEMNVWTSEGSTHVWNLTAKGVRSYWQEEVDRLMREQLVTLDYAQRKRIYDRVQEILWENSPVIFLVSPDILVGAKEEIGNFRPAILSSHTLWNIEQLFWSRPESSANN